MAIPTSSSGIPGPLHGDAFPKIVRTGGVIPGDLRQVCQDMSGADGVAANSILSKLNRHGTGEGDHAALGRTIYGASSQHSLVIVRADINNVAAFAFIHFSGNCLADEKHTFQVGIHDAVVSLFLHIQKAFALVDTGNIEQHVNLSVVLDDLGYTLPDAIHICYIQMKGGAWPPISRISRLRS